MFDFNFLSLGYKMSFDLQTKGLIKMKTKNKLILKKSQLLEQGYISKKNKIDNMNACAGKFANYLLFYSLFILLNISKGIKTGQGLFKCHGFRHCLRYYLFTYNCQYYVNPFFKSFCVFRKHTYH